MKIMSSVLFCLILGAFSAFGQVILDSGAASLTSVANTTISTVGSGTGQLKSVACAVTAGVGGSPSDTLRVTLDSVHTTSYTLYSGSNLWVTSLLPFLTQTGQFPGATSSTPDTFILPLDVPYTNGLTIDVHVTAAGSTGTLTCSALHT